MIRCYDIDWKSRIIAVTDDYVVLDKPAGTSVSTKDLIKYGFLLSEIL